MLDPYRRVLTLPGAARFSTAGFVARLPISMNGLGIVLLISATTGSYTLAGLVSGVYLALTAVGAPLSSQLADRYGQGRMLRPVLAVHAVGTVALLVAGRLAAPAPVLLASAALAGVTMPVVGSLVRARWAGLLRQRDEGGRVHTAFALEAVIDEVIFVVGPLLVTVLDTQITAGAGLGTALGLALVGGYVLAALRSTEPVPDPAGVVGAAARPPALWLLCGVFVAIGAVFGGLDVAVVGFADERGSRAAAGVVLASVAAGSMVSGLAYGARDWRTPVVTRFVLAVCGFAVVFTLLPLAPTVPVLLPLAFLAGASIAPTLTSGAALVERIVPPGAVTQGMGLAIAGIGLGGTVGASVGGWAVDSLGARTAFGVSIVAAALAALVALVSRRALAVAAGGPVAVPPAS